MSLRLAAAIEYNGSGFHGWQLQRGAVSVQEVVETAFGAVANQPIRVHCAGRTDSGVHALWQVIHFDTDAERAARGWLLGANAHLPQEVSVLWVQAVRDDFHARFSATHRSYSYLILNRSSRPGLMNGRATWVRRALDEQRMHSSAQVLLGTHDFSSFRALACQAKHPVRTITRIGVERRGDWVVIRVTANAFLHHMVRNIAGVLLSVGTGDRPVTHTADLLLLKDRTRGEVTAPSDGLYFTGVGYPAAYGLPEYGEAESGLPW